MHTQTRHVAAFPVSGMATGFKLLEIVPTGMLSNSLPTCQIPKVTENPESHSYFSPK